MATQNASTKRAAPTPAERSQLVALFNAGRYVELESQSRLLVERYPETGIAWKVLGVSLHAQRKEALPALQKATELLPDDAEAHSNLGNALQDLGQHEAAEASYRQALEIKPDFAAAHNNLGNALRDLGQHDAAVGSYRRALEIKPDFAEAHSNLGNALRDLGQLDAAVASYRWALEIKPDFVDAHSNLGNALQDLGQHDAAVSSYRRALEIKPDYAKAHSNLGNALRHLGQHDAAVGSYRRALEINPDFAEAHGNLGNALKDLGQLDAAVASYRRALEIKPDYAKAQSNLGNALRDLGQLDAAVGSYRRALEIKPDLAEAHSNMGNALRDLGQLDAAEASYRQALEIKPDFVDALNNLAFLLNTQGKSAMAMDTIIQSLQIKETGDAKSNFVACVKRLNFTYDDDKIRAYLVRALIEPWDRPSDLARTCTNFIKLTPDTKKIMARAADAWPLWLSEQDLFGSNGLNALADDPLLCALLDSSPICDIEMERFLTMARRALLEAAAGLGNCSSIFEAGSFLSFYSALARQCFINEYVFCYTDAEIQKAVNLRDSLVAALETNDQVPALWLIAVAAYFPLCLLPHVTRLLERQWPDDVATILVQQVREPAEEKQLRATISRLTNIENDVSLRVQNQYEENPYPRWIKIDRNVKPVTVGAALRRMFPLAEIHPIDKCSSPDILIAGCGTGQHPIGAAQRFQGARVLAVDLSLASLSYAKRKTRELGFTSIEYAQADLLNLAPIGRSFDLIESVGVLHHLDDPWTGWRVLLSLLRPCGFMKLGFYSEVARRNIVRIRTIIAEQDYGETPNEIRRCRQDLMGLDNSADFGATLKLSDFFSISTCRDLLFHVQEHRMTLTGIDAFLQDNNLSFLGFEIDPQVLRAYRLRFPDDRVATNLAQWQIFENENPDVFLGMYQFWIQKVG